MLSETSGQRESATVNNPAIIVGFRIMQAINSLLKYIGRNILKFEAYKLCISKHGTFQDNIWVKWHVSLFDGAKATQFYLRD